jgi:hypothetical protein
MRYAALIVIAIAANPRLSSYDFAFANLPAFYIYGSRLEQLARPERGPWLSLLAGLMAASWSILWLPVFTTHYKIWRAEQDLWVVLFFGGAVLLATQWRLFEAYFPNRRAVAATAVG